MRWPTSSIRELTESNSPTYFVPYAQGLISRAVSRRPNVQRTGGAGRREDMRQATGSEGSGTRLSTNVQAAGYVSRDIGRAGERFETLLLAVFAGLGTGVSTAIGLYGVVAYGTGGPGSARGSSASAWRSARRARRSCGWW